MKKYIPFFLVFVAISCFATALVFNVVPSNTKMFWTGDSITAGAPEPGWIDYVTNASVLNFRYSSSTNAANNGWSSQNVLDQLPVDIIPYFDIAKTSIVTWRVGANDGFSTTYPGEALAYIGRASNSFYLITNAGGYVHAIDITPNFNMTNATTGGTYWSNWTMVNLWLRTNTMKTWFTSAADLIPTNKINDTAFLIDTLHPSAAIQQMTATNFVLVETTNSAPFQPAPFR